MKKSTKNYQKQFPDLSNHALKIKHQISNKKKRITL